MTKTQKTKLQKIRKEVDKEKKRLRISSPKWTIQLDSKTDKILIGYSVPINIGKKENGERIVRQKQKKKYLPNAKLDDSKYIVMNVQNYTDLVLSEINKTTKSIGGDKDSIDYWSEEYKNPIRKGNIELSKSTISNDISTLKNLSLWLEEHEPKMLNVWEWTDEGKDCLIRYMKYRQNYGGVTGRKWNDTSVNSEYRRIRAFFNYLSENLNGFPSQLLNNIPFKKSKTKTETFTKMEIHLVKEFMLENETHLRWKWFVPILHTLLETGCRVSEVVKLLIRDLDIDERKVGVIGKGNKKRFLYLKSDSLWKRLNPYIFTSKGKIRTDKEFIFHWNIGHPSNGKYFPKEDLSKGFHPSGVQHKFKDMIRELKLNMSLSTHDTRRYYITEMLKKTNGNVPLVAQLVGHNTWDVVRLYTKNMIDENQLTNVGLFD
jgi:site-specific recombinase XerD